MTPRDIVARLLADRPRRPVRDAATAFAPANIALCKYWGKRNETLNLPVTGSISMSLGTLGSEVTLAVRRGGDRVELNGAPLPPDGAFARRVSAFLDLFRAAPDSGYRVAARNTVPTAAGFASSASGFAALVKALMRCMAGNLKPEALSILARLGSGSAARSVFDGFAEWFAGERDDGMDSFAVPLAWTGPSCASDCS